MGTSTAGTGGVLLSTKLNPPVAAHERVARAALVDRLVDKRARRLTLIDAPPGWGKSSLLAEWVADPRERRRFAWFTVDRSDNDPVRFWTYATTALTGLVPALDEATGALGVSGTDPVDVVLPPLINTLATLDERIVLVVEDYHLITNDDVHRGVAFLLEHAPPTLELVLATRMDPPLPLSRLRTSGALLELRAQELSFNRDETAALLETVLGGRLADADVALLVERTEGWAAGLYLAALSLTDRDDRSEFIRRFAGDDRHIVDYLGGEVLDGLDADVRSFLLRTSVLDKLCARLCDHVTGGGDGYEKLAAIERANLFLVPLDDRREWYRYHQLFSELLRHELERSSPGEAATLHERAAGWLAQHGAIDDAIRHAVAAADMQLAVALVTAEWRAAFNRGELATVDRWLDHLAEETVAASPELCLARAWVALDRGLPRDAERFIPGAAVAGTSESAAVEAVLNFKLGRIAEAGARALQAQALAGEDSPLGGAAAGCIVGISLYFRGLLGEAADALESARRRAELRDNTLATVYAGGYLALTRLELGEESGARAAAEHALSLAARPPASEHFVRAAATLAQGRLDEDEDAVAQALALSRRGAAPPEIALATLTLGRLSRDPVLLREAGRIAAGCEDPGRLPALVEEAELALRGRRPGPRRDIAGDLSDRELAVLKLMPSDASLREIAVSLYVSLNTVKTHSRSIYRKLGASSREEAVEKGRTLGLL